MFETKKAITGDRLKLIALVTMAIDHTGMVLFPMQPVWRMIGRIAFPIFVWLLVQGFCHTSNRRRYIGNMAVFALISEVPFDLAVGGRLSFGWQNVYFTLLLGLLQMAVLEKLAETDTGEEKNSGGTGNIVQAGAGSPAAWSVRLRYLLSVLTVAAAMAIAQWLNFDYGCSGQVLVAVFYLYVRRGSPTLEIGFILFCLSILGKPFLRGEPVWEGYVWKSVLSNLEMECFGILALPLLWQYNGVRKLKRGKYFFYWFYPLHLLALYAVSRMMAGFNTGIL